MNHGVIFVVNHSRCVCETDEASNLRFSDPFLPDLGDTAIFSHRNDRKHDSTASRAESLLSMITILNELPA